MDRFLPGVLWDYRNTPHESTKEKPSFLLFGIDLRFPTEAARLSPEPIEYVDLTDYQEELVLSLSSAREMAAQSIRDTQGHYKEQYDKKSRPVDLRVGECVFVHFPQDETGKQRKLSRPWRGPFRITQRNDPDVTVVKVYYSEKGPLQIHLSRVCPSPLKLLVGFYWYGGNRKSAGRIPQWVKKLFQDKGQPSIQNSWKVQTPNCQTIRKE